MHAPLTPEEEFPEIMNNQDIRELFGQINTLIEVYIWTLILILKNVGSNIEKACQAQEDKFLEDYRQQMYEAQKNLRDFSQNVQFSW
mgnify:CR=1 FL=1